MIELAGGPVSPGCAIYAPRPSSGPQPGWPTLIEPEPAPETEPSTKHESEEEETER